MKWKINGHPTTLSLHANHYQLDIITEFKSCNMSNCAMVPFSRFFRKNRLTAPWYWRETNCSGNVSRQWVFDFQPIDVAQFSANCWRCLLSFELMLFSHDKGLSGLSRCSARKQWVSKVPSCFNQISKLLDFTNAALIAFVSLLEGQLKSYLS